MSYEAVVHGSVTHEYHREAGYTTHVTFYNKSAAGPDTQPLYSCWAELPDGRKSPELNTDVEDENRYPLSNQRVLDRLHNFVG